MKSIRELASECVKETATGDKAKVDKLLTDIRNAFDGDNVPRKNIMLRRAYDMIEKCNK